MPEMRMDAYMEACTSFTMRGSRKFFSDGGPTLTTYFFCWWWERWFKYQYKRAIIGPAAKRHLNGVSLAGCWWPNIESLLGSCVILQGIRTSMAKKPYIFVIIRGWGAVRTPCPPPLWIRTCFLQCAPDLNPPFRLRSACAYVQL